MEILLALAAIATVIVIVVAMSTPASAAQTPITITPATNPNPINIDNLCRDADAIANRGDIPRAERMLLTALEQNPNSATLLFAIGAIHIDDLKKKYRPAALDNKRDAAALVATWNRGEHKGIHYLERAKSLTPNDPAVLSYLRVAWAMMSRALEAVEEWENADLAWDEVMKYRGNDKTGNADESAAMVVEKLKQQLVAQLASGISIENTGERAQSMARRAWHAMDLGWDLTTGIRFDVALILDANNVDALVGRAKYIAGCVDYMLNKSKVGILKSDLAMYRKEVQDQIDALGKARMIAGSDTRIASLESELQGYQQRIGQ